MTSAKLNNISLWCRTHWHWVFSVALHLVILLALLLNVSSTPQQYQVRASATLPKQPQIVNAQMVSMSQVIPPKPKLLHHAAHKKVVKPKPRPKAKITHKIALKKSSVRSKPKKVPKHIVHKTPAKRVVNKRALEALRTMALSGIEQQKRQIATQQRWQTEKEKYLGLIQQLVRLNWNNPDPDAKLQVVLLISLNAKGQVQSVSVSRSSGNAAFDRQAVLAVQKSSPLPLPKDQQLAQQFSTLRLPFGG